MHKIKKNKIHSYNNHIDVAEKLMIKKPTTIKTFAMKRKQRNLSGYCIKAEFDNYILSPFLFFLQTHFS